MVMSWWVGVGSRDDDDDGDDHDVKKNDIGAA